MELFKKNSRTPVSTIALVLALALLTLAVLVLTSCGDEGATVTIKDFSFEPETVTIKAGETVTWVNEDRRNHMVMSGAPPVMTDQFMSPALQKGDSWSYTFEEAGEYPYHSMTGSFLGRVIVEE